jgi:hypothetical protein
MHSVAIGYVVATLPVSAAHMRKIVDVDIAAVAGLCADVATNPNRLHLKALSPRR